VVSRRTTPTLGSGLFVIGTDTGAGKTVLSAALLAAMSAAGFRARAHKPVVTGLDEPTGTWPCDHDLLARVTGTPPDAVAPVSYGPAASPHLAAELAGQRLDYGAILARARAALAAARKVGATLVIEGVGGILTPLTEERSIRDLAADLALPVVLSARPGLGTINHTLLTLEAARTAGLAVRAVVLTPWPREPSVLEHSNRATIARRGRTDVHVLSTLTGPDSDELARAGGELPWPRWLRRSGDQARSASSAAARRARPLTPARAAASTARHTAATSSSSMT
jgi:dethiobiotin synthetase